MLEMKFRVITKSTDDPIREEEAQADRDTEDHHKRKLTTDKGFVYLFDCCFI